MRLIRVLTLCVLAASSASAAQPTVPKAGEMKRAIEKLLEDELTKGWYPRTVDKERGGFRQNLGRDWSLQPDENRFVVYQARMVWTAAAYARFNPSRRDEFATYTEHGVDYLDRVLRDEEHGGFHWIVDPNGQVDPKLGDEKHVYGTAFVLYAASEAYKTNKSVKARKVAREAFDWLEKHAHDAEHGGYFEAFRRDGTPILTWDESAPVAKRADRIGTYYGFKSMNSHIHLLEALAEFSRVDADPIVKARLAEVHALVRDKIAAEPGALNLYLTREWQATPAHDSFGHDIETAYLLVEAAEALHIPDDPKTWHVARRLVDHALDWGWDRDHGGFYYKGEAFAGEAFDKHKDWWTQAEGWNVLLLMHAKYGATTSKYRDAFLKEWAFIQAHLIDPVHHGWYMETTREGALMGDGRKATQWKANYHTSRAMMNVAKMLGAMERAARD